MAVRTRWQQEYKTLLNMYNQLERELELERESKGGPVLVTIVFTTLLGFAAGLTIGVLI